MTEAPESTSGENASAPKLLFAWSVAAAVGCVVTLVGWAATDASFRWGVWKTRFALHVESISSVDPSADATLAMLPEVRSVKWDAVGKRAMALGLLCGAGLIATAMACHLAAQHATLRRLVTCGMLFVAWITFFGSRQVIDDWRSHRQVSRLLPEFEHAGSTLSHQWPTEPGEISSKLKFFVRPERYPNVLTLRNRGSSYPVREDFGRTIVRDDDGIIRFDLAAAYDTCVEFHPQGTTPAPYVSRFGNPSPPVASVRSLKKNWYLVRYGRS